MTYEQLQQNGYRLHHTSLFRGYVSRKEHNTELISYDGRFGTGYKALLPNADSTYYSFVQYWVKEA